MGKTFTQEEKLTQEENIGLRQLFGNRLQGAEIMLKRDPIEMPEGVTRDTLERYRKIARKAISDGKDDGVQKKRIEIIDRLVTQGIV